MRVRALVATLLVNLLAGAAAISIAAPAATAQTTDVVVGVPIRNGQAGRPQPGVIVDLEGRQRRDPLPAPIIIQQANEPGTTTVRPNFGGGYTVENENGATTTVRPNFGGGYTIEKQVPAPKPQ